MLRFVMISKQVVLIGLLFIGLMLLSAGIGATVAGELLIGLGMLSGGLLLAGIISVILFQLRKKSIAN